MGPAPVNLLDIVVGKPIKTSDERAEQIGPAQGIPIFGLDALSSAAYGPEAALSLLMPLGLMGVRYIIPISAAIIALLVIVYFSYRQTIAAYPIGRRLLHCGALQSGRARGIAGGGCAAGGLHSHGGRWHFGGSGGAGLGGAVAAAAHGGDLPGDSDRHHHLEFAGCAGGGRGVRGSHLFICGHAADHYRGGTVSSALQRRPSRRRSLRFRLRRQ